MDQPTEDKAQLLAQLRAEFQHWETLLASLSEAELTVRQFEDGMSVKDILAHLWTWQQRSIARLEAAQGHHDPLFPEWPGAGDPDDDATRDINAINAWIYAQSHDKTWEQVHGDWSKGFWRFLELCENTPEDDLLAVGKYAWLGEYQLADVLRGSYDHHHEEHLQPLLVRLGRSAQS